MSSFVSFPLFFSNPVTSAKTEIIAISGATLVDGSGRRPVKNSLVIVNGDTIVAVGRVGQTKIPQGALFIDGSNLVLAPGFIDTHSQTERGLDSDPSAATQVSQGITTAVVRQHGGSEWPIGAFLEKLDSSPTALNVATFVGHATLRSRVMGEDINRAASEKEIESMKSLVDQAMREGAFGLSSGLEYETGKPAMTEEMVSTRFGCLTPWWSLYQPHSR